MLALGLGAAGDADSHDFLTNAAWKSGLVAFVARGGLLLMHGERYISSAFAWFGNVSWKADSYFRPTHSYCPANAAARSWYPTAASERSNFSVKACMLSGVAPAEQLFASTDSRGEGATSSPRWILRGRQRGSGSVNDAGHPCALLRKTTGRDVTPQAGAPGSDGSGAKPRTGHDVQAVWRAEVVLRVGQEQQE